MTPKSARDERVKLLLNPQLLKEKLEAQFATLKPQLATYSTQPAQEEKGVSISQIREYINFQKKLGDLKKQLSSGKTKLESVKEELKNICNSFTQAFA